MKTKTAHKFSNVIGEGTTSSSTASATSYSIPFYSNTAKTVQSIEGKVSRKKKSLSVNKQKAQKTKALERAVFGGTAHFAESNFQEAVTAKKTKGKVSNEEIKQETPAWVDSEDESEQIPNEVKVSRKFLKSSQSAASTKWAREPAPESMSLEGKNVTSMLSDNEDLAAVSEKILLPKDRFTKLARSKLKASKCRELNQIKPSELAINSVQFHETDRIALVGGEDTCLSLFRVDGRENRNIASVPFENFPIKVASFISDTQSILLTSLYKSFYTYDYGALKVVEHHGVRTVDDKIFEKFVVSKCGNFIAMKGFYGRVYLLQSLNLELVKTFTLNNYVEGMSFTNDTSYFVTSDCHGQVYVFDLRKMDRCLKKFQDEGSSNTLSVALSPDSSILACGSYNGILNLYDFDSILSTSDKFPKPLKCFKNLTTMVDNVKFNSSNEFCVYSSKLVKNSVRVVHLDSLTVFEDFPLLGQNLGCVKTFDISPHSKYLSFGSKSGKCRLYDVSHYNRY
ncbi:U3 small nucleolar RNA-associated protein 18 homolog [Convolutriloba macropyga]|uniref:U3 small nucleolar RNA-associated protein 18 homolog n=1 Tax=Convolutriloba macropyga TaxID=536237 RepID=UPI003F525D6C